MSRVFSKKCTIPLYGVQCILLFNLNRGKNGEKHYFSLILITQKTAYIRYFSVFLLVKTLHRREQEHVSDGL